MTRSRRDEDDSLVDAALDAMDAEQLRGLVRAFIPGLDDATRARLLNEVVDRAARSTGGWTPSSPSERRIKEIEAFAAAARRVYRADPSDVDAYLREGTHAFLAREYAAAYRIFRALLIPIGEGDIDLGQRELVDEVLGTDVDACAKQYVVAMYMTASPTKRASAVFAAIEDVQGIGYFFEPIREIELVAVEPLPDLDDFLVAWRELIEERVGATAKSQWDRGEARWLREVVARTRGPEGLGEVARQSKQADDLRAWCHALVEAGDWDAARGAYEEAAELIADGGYDRGEFLDGAALAAQELGSDDLDSALERAWRQAPSLTRLRRWLGGCSTRTDVIERSAVAFEAAPANAARQRALLHILRAELDQAAQLLADAQGLGWSDPDHPGPLVFPVFVALLGGDEVSIQLPRSYDDLSERIVDDRPRLRTPDIDALLLLADVKAHDESSVRAAMIHAMREAAEKRVQAVTGSKRRRHYGHAASLAVHCARVDGSPAGKAAGKAWLRDLIDEYRRYPALQREFEAAAS